MKLINSLIVEYMKELIVGCSNEHGNGGVN